jgi:pyruvate,water dikinase
MAEAARAPELAGGKAHTLSRLLEETGLPGPRGRAISTSAFRNFLEHNHLRHRLDELLAQVPLDDWDRLTELSREMAALVQHAAIPPLNFYSSKCEVSAIYFQ